MGHPWDPELGVLHTLRLRGFAQPEDIVRSTGFDHEVVVEVLGAALARRSVRHRQGRISGYTLTPAGRERDRSLVALEMAAGVDRHHLRLQYEAFLALN